MILTISLFVVGFLLWGYGWKQFFRLLTWVDQLGVQKKP